MRVDNFCFWREQEAVDEAETAVRLAERAMRSVQIPQVNTAVPMTFLHQGKQYIVFASGAGDCTKLIALTLP